MDKLRQKVIQNKGTIPLTKTESAQGRHSNLNGTWLTEHRFDDGFYVGGRKLDMVASQSYLIPIGFPVIYNKKTEDLQYYQTYIALYRSIIIRSKNFQTPQIDSEMFDDLMPDYVKN